MAWSSEKIKRIFGRGGSGTAVCSEEVALCVGVKNPITNTTSEKIRLRTRMEIFREALWLVLDQVKRAMLTV